MEANEALNQLHFWCQQSNGSPIEIKPSVRRSFDALSTFAEADLQSIEEALVWSLPDTYKAFLQLIGQCTLFLDDHGLGLYFYSPDEVISASLSIWDEEEEPGEERFCFIGENRSIGDYFGFVISRNDPANFDVFCHEYPPSEYMAVSDELKSWRTLEHWFVQIVTSYGEETL